VKVQRIAKSLAAIVGDDRVTTDPAQLAVYSHDMTENDDAMPDIVVRPVSTEQVQGIVKLAGAEEIPLVPVVARTNLGGLTNASRGGIIVDLCDMDSIEVDRTSMHAYLGPGVGFGKLADYLKKNAPELTVSYALSPPEASVLANCILDGLGNLSLRHGTMADQLAGLEVVLADGSVVRTGAGALSYSWFSRAPFPDLTGLFVNWQGTTGIVTRCSVCLWPLPPLRMRRFIPTYDLTATFALMRDLSRTGVFDDIGGLTWPAAKMLFGVKRPMTRDPGEPEFFLYTDLSANDKSELKAKERVAARVLRAHKGRVAMDAPLAVEALTSMAPSFAKFADFPMTLDFLTEYEGGGLTWVGTYGPTGKWEEAAAKGSAALMAEGFPPMLVVRPMKGGHFGVLRFITCFDRSDPQEVARVRAANTQILQVCLETGFIPYKTPSWAFKVMAEHMDPGYLELFKKIKAVMDPKGIMNPGRFGL